MANTHKQSVVAAVGVSQSLKERMAKAQKSGTFWKVAAFGTAFLGAFGLGASYLMERKKNNAVRNSQLDVLAEYYRYQIAGTLGMNPDNVTASDLKTAAQMNPALRQAIQKVEDKRSSANRGAGLSSAGVLAVGGMIPGVSGVAKIGADLIGSAVGSGVSNMFDKNVLHVNDMVEHIDAKLKAGEAITAQDIMILRVAQNDKWQQDFMSRYKTPFHKMKPETQSQVIASMPELMEGAGKQAYALNSGLVSPQSLVMEGPSSLSNHAGAVVRQMPGASFAETENARRMNAQQQGQVRA